MSAVYPNAKELAALFEAVGVVADKAPLKLDEDGLRIRALDSAKVAAVELFLPAGAFEEYKAGARAIVRLSDVYKLLRTTRPGDKIAFEIDGGRLKAKLVGRSARSVALPVYEGGEEAPELAFEHVVVATLRADVLEKAVKDVAIIADYLELEAADMLYLRAEGDKGDVEVGVGQEAMVGLEVKTPAKARYPLSRLKDVATKAARVAEFVVLKFAANAPLVLEYGLGDGGRLTYYIAPLI